MSGFCKNGKSRLHLKCQLPCLRTRKDRCEGLAHDLRTRLATRPEADADDALVDEHAKAVKNRAASFGCVSAASEFEAGSG